MPNVISLLPASLPQITHDPTVTLQGDPMGVLGKNPYGSMTDALLFGAVNTLLGWIDDATGLDLLGLVSPLESLLGGSTGLLTGLLGFLTPGGSTAGGGVFGPLLGLIPGLGGGSGTLGGLGSFLNPTGFIGAAAGIFAPLLSGGSLLGGLIPGLDASKITSGTFGAGPLQPFIDAVSTGFGGSSGLGIPGLSSFLSTLSLVGVAFNDLIALIPGATGGLSGSTGLGSIFTDLTHILGSPTALGSGTPVLPGIGSIPILGGLLSGGNILGSIIPGLDASKITSGLFGAGLIPGLDVSKIVSGVFGTGFIPNLPAGQITSGIFGAGLIPGLDASKITTGIFSLGQLPTTVLNSVTGVAGSLINSVLGTGVIPNLPAGQITSGVFGAGLIPGLDASKIVSGLFGAGLIPGLDVSKIVSGVFGTGFIPNLPAGQITSGVFGAGLIPGLDASKITSGTIAEVTTGLGTLRDSFLNGLFGGVTGSGYSNAQAQQQAATVAQQASSAAAAAAAANATLAAQAAQQNSNNAGGGIYKIITPSGADGAALSATDFASTGPTSGDLTIRGSNGYIGVKASAATNTVGYYAILNYAFTTDNQSMEVTLGDQGSYDSSYTTLYMHADTAHTVGAYCSIGSGRIVIGSYTRSGGTYTYTPFSGGTYTGTIQSGQRAGFRNIGTSWNITLNGNAILTVINASVTFNSARRSAAVSMDRQHSSGFFGWGAADYDSFRIASISMADYVVPTYLGSGARMIRTSTTGVAQTTTATSQLLPNNFFGVTDKATADITADLTTGKFTVANAGWYRMSMRYQLSANFTTTGTAFMTQTPLLYKNGSIAMWGCPHWSYISSTFANGAGPLSVWSSFEVYLAAGDNVQVGYNNSAALFGSGGQMIGEAGGVQTYFEIALLNRSTM